jgi:hypothetical protein
MKIHLQEQERLLVAALGAVAGSETTPARPATPAKMA